MGKKDPQTVEQPDPWEVAQADATYNRIDQNTPFGSLTFSGPNRNQATMTFSPEMQQLFNTRMATDQSMMDNALGRLQGLDNNQIDLSQFGAIQGDAGLSEFDPSTLNLTELPTDMDAYRTEVEDATFRRGDRLLNPYYQRQERALTDRLANQGLPQGDRAYRDEFDSFRQNRSRAYQDLADQSVMMGGQETSRLLANALASRGQLFNEGVQSNVMNNQTRQQALVNQNAGRAQGLQEAMGIRGNAFNELASLLGLQQVQAPTMQNYFAPGQVDYLGAQGLSTNAGMFNAQQANQMSAAGMQGLFGLGNAGIGAWGMRG